MAYGSIKGITIEFRGDTTQLDKALRTVKSEAKNTQNELKAIDRALKFNPRSVESWKQKQTVLTKAIEDTEEKLKKLKEAEAEMSKKGMNSENSEEFRKLQREIQATEQDLKNFEKQLKQIGNANLQALGHQFKEVGAKMTDVGKKMSMYVTAPLVGVGTAAAKGFAEVDKVMQLTNKTMNNSVEEAEMLNQAMKDAAANSTFGMNDAATATLNFARAGLTAEQAAATLAPAMNLAAGEGGNLDTVSAGLVATINGFGDSFDNASQYADIFANACNNSALDIDSLSSSMSVAAPIFSAAGYSVKDATLYMGTMANAGIEASVAANALKTGMARLVSPSKDAQGWMDKLGISVTNADGSMKDSITVQKELNEAFSGLSESEQLAAASAIFGKNQMSNWLALINTAPSEVQALNDVLDEEGTVLEMAGAMMSGFGGSLEQLKSSLNVATVSLGEALAPIILKVANGIQSLVDWFNNLSPAAKRIVAVVGTLVAALGPMLLIMGTMVGAIGNLMIHGGAILGIFTKLGGAAKILSGSVIKLVTLAFNPWVIAIAAAVAAGVLIYKNWDKISAYAKKLWENIKTVFDNIKKWIIESWTKVKQTTTQIWQQIVSAITTAWNTIKSVTTTVFNTIKAFLTTIFRAYVTLVTIQVNAIKTVITTVWNAIKTVTTAVWNGIKTVTSTVWNAIKNAIVSPINAAKAAVTSVVNSIKNAFSFSGIAGKVQTAFNSVKSAITTPIQKAWDLVKSAVDKIKSIFPIQLGKIFSGIKLPHFKISGGKVPWGVGGKGVKPSIDIEWYKKGGIFTRPTIFATGSGFKGVGEAGAEAVLPLDRLWEQMANMGNTIADGVSKAQGDEITINVYAQPGMDIKTLAEEIERRLIETQKRRRVAWQ